jgi:hypothetical protein
VGFSSISLSSRSPTPPRLKERGYLTWHVERLPGRPRTGRDVYVFGLHPDGPREAEKVLPSPVRDVSARACPSSEGPERRSGAAVSASEPRGVSEFGVDAETDLASELPADLSEFCETASQREYGEVAARVNGSCPSSSDVQSKQTLSCTERLEE